MTFIASIIAKEGIAIIADSFGTTMEQSLDKNKLLEYINKAEYEKNMPINELSGLFTKKPSYTRNYVDKLFKFGDFSAITFTGAIYINGKEIKEIIRSIAIDLLVDTPSYKAKDISIILEEFCEKLRSEVIQHGKVHDLTSTQFIFSHFNTSEGISQIFLIEVKGIVKDIFQENDPNLIVCQDQTYLGIVTNGQNTFVDRLLFGSLIDHIADVKSEIINKVVRILNLNDVNKKVLTQSINDADFLKQMVVDDIFSIKFRELNLQEALDLAALFIKIVIDIQVYTEKIPTVGGLIKLAYIHEEKGFNWISGHNLIASKMI